MRNKLIASLTVLGAVIFLCAAVTRAAQQTRSEAFTAIAIPPGTSGPPTPIDIVVERWSTPAENERVMTAIAELGTKGLLDVLLKLPQVGSLAATGAVGYPVRYAWKTTGLDGVEHITLVTDRAASFWELSGQTRSLDYPITLVDMQIKPGNHGDGRVFVAAQISRDPATKGIVVEDFGFQPVLLTNVKRSR